MIIESIKIKQRKQKKDNDITKVNHDRNNGKVKEYKGKIKAKSIESNQMCEQNETLRV